MTKAKEEFQPYISSQKNIKEFTPKALILGVIIGLIFGIGNAYLGLKVGITVSASIPAAVLSMTILHLFFKRVTILENNMVQTVASVGEGIAAGVIFTVPALYILGSPPPLYEIILLSLLGGMLGILFMIPMRRYIIVEEHGKLPFPEGTACAEILKSRESGKENALMAISGIILGTVYKVLSSVLNLWDETASWTIKKLGNFEIAFDCTPALLGVGYIIGPRICMTMLFGGALGWWVIIPLISMFSQGGAVIYPGTIPVDQMNAEQIWSNYVRFIGAGAIAVGGLFNMMKIFPLIKKTFLMAFIELTEKRHARRGIPRTDRDISLKWLVVGCITIILFLWLFPYFPMNFLMIVLLVILGFFFAGVTSITVGIVGSSSCPASGMTITTLLITCAIFVALGWTERVYLIAALTMSIVINITIALASTTSQDLKTGYLLGATPKAQQIGEMIGMILPAIALSFTVFLLNEAYGFGSRQMPAPQGTLMALIAKGVISGDIPYTLVFIGAVIGVIVAILGLPILSVAIGLYLPISLSTGVFLGGLLALIMARFGKSETTQRRGILASSGLVAGDACTGVVVAGLIAFAGMNSAAKPLFPMYVGLTMFVILSIVIGWICVKPPKFLRK
ncbi:oligopeptide transporter, OPT family [Candidatus Aerophobetes bacterium]|uniref:Oligopeptide transporter, OPT family n=1 Tax=Aerophobetes bacterium TaxID=2030807 RepID=A0A2A4YJP0_UNCAE|nr:MAG: oligopeptide transporter, OPT family [Candidatus Aerophobetes bacterium]